LVCIEFYLMNAYSKFFRIELKFIELKSIRILQ